MRYDQLFCKLVIAVTALLFGWLVGFYAHTYTAPTTRVAVLYSHSFGVDYNDAPIEYVLVNNAIARQVVPPVIYTQHFTNKANLTRVVQTLYNTGVRVFVGVLISSDLGVLEDFASTHQDAVFISTASTAKRFEKYDNIIRLSAPDSRTLDMWNALMDSAYNGLDIVISITQDDVWARELSKMLQDRLSNSNRTVYIVPELQLLDVATSNRVLIVLTTNLELFFEYVATTDWAYSDIVFGDSAAYVSMPYLESWVEANNRKHVHVVDNARDVALFSSHILQQQVSPFVSELLRALQMGGSVALLEHATLDGARLSDLFQLMYGPFAGRFLDENGDRYGVKLEALRLQRVEDTTNSSRRLSTSNAAACMTSEIAMLQESDNTQWSADVLSSLGCVDQTSIQTPPNEYFTSDEALRLSCADVVTQYMQEEQTSALDSILFSSSALRNQLLLDCEVARANLYRNAGGTQIGWQVSAMK